MGGEIRGGKEVIKVGGEAPGKEIGGGSRPELPPETGLKVMGVDLKTRHRFEEAKRNALEFEFNRAFEQFQQLASRRAVKLRLDLYAKQITLEEFFEAKQLPEPLWTLEGLWRLVTGHADWIPDILARFGFAEAFGQKAAETGGVFSGHPLGAASHYMMKDFRNAVLGYPVDSVGDPAATIRSRLGLELRSFVEWVNWRSDVDNTERQNPTLEPLNFTAERMRREVELKYSVYPRADIDASSSRKAVANEGSAPIETPKQEFHPILSITGRLNIANPVEFLQAKQIHRANRTIFFSNLSEFKRAAEQGTQDLAVLAFAGWDGTQRQEILVTKVDNRFDAQKPPVNFETRRLPGGKKWRLSVEGRYTDPPDKHPYQIYLESDDPALIETIHRECAQKWAETGSVDIAFHWLMFEGPYKDLDWSS